MVLTKGKGPVTFLYIGSLCSVPSALFDCKNTAVVFAFLLFSITTIAAMETTIQTIKAVAELKDIVYTVLITDLYIPAVSVVSELCVAWLSIGCMVPVGVLIVGSVV